MRLIPVVAGAPNCVPAVVVVWNVMLNGAAVPATTGRVIVLASGRLTLVPAEMPQVVGVPALPVGAEGRFVGQFSVTVPLNVSSGTICNWNVAGNPCSIVIWYGAPFDGGGHVKIEVVMQVISKSSATPLATAVSDAVAPV